MRVGVLGLGKLGLPIAMALEQAGHEIVGWDVSGERRHQIEGREVPEAAHEPHLARYLEQSRLVLRSNFCGIKPEVVLVCVQTPHQPQFEGVTPLTEPPQDFDYTWLRHAVQVLARQIRCVAGWDPLVVVVSTCLPGTFDRELRDILDGVPRTQPTPTAWTAWRAERPIRFAYHPLFIAMGSVIDDYRRPEFILVGTDSRSMPLELSRMYAGVLPGVPYRPPLRCMSIRSAELTKVAYNAWLGYKLMLANGIAMTCDAVEANCDDVMDTLKVADKRLVSTAYMTPGMGDGGGCHPRDQIALSWLAREHELPHDPYAVVVEAREQHAKWLADLWIEHADRTGLGMAILGTEYKANSTLTVGSHQRLVLHYARAQGREPQVIAGITPGCSPSACWFLGTPHNWVLEAGLTGVLIDPWGVARELDGLEIVRPGRRA